MNQTLLYTHVVTVHKNTILMLYNLIYLPYNKRPKAVTNIHDRNPELILHFFKDAALDYM